MMIQGQIPRCSFAPLRTGLRDDKGGSLGMIRGREEQEVDRRTDGPELPTQDSPGYKRRIAK